MANRVARDVRPRAMRPDREPARSTNPNRFNVNSNDGINGILVDIDFVDLQFDTGAIDSAAKVDLINLNKVTRGPIINPDDLWDSPFDSVADSIDLIEFSSDNGAASPMTDLDSIEISSDKGKQAADLATDVNSIDVNSKNGSPTADNNSNGRETSSSTDLIDLATDVDSINVNSKNDSPIPNNNANSFETSSSTDLIDLWPNDGSAHARYKKVIGMRPTIDLINLWSDTNILPVNMDLVDFTMHSGIMGHTYSDIEPSMSSMGSIESFDPNVDNGRIGLYRRRMNSWSEHTHSGYRSINPVESFPDSEVGSATSSPLDTVYTTKSSSGPEGQSVASFPFVYMSSPEAEVGSPASSSLDTAHATKSSSGPEASVPLLAMSTPKSEDGSVTSSPLDTVYTTKSNSGPGAGSGPSIPSVGMSNAEAEGGSVTASPLDTVYTDSGLGAEIGVSDSSDTVEAAGWGEDFNSVAPDTVNSWSSAFAEGLIARLEALQRG
ncbi:hypothetical protein PENSOL_c001G09559 [Penicillium solitum]|uniref:Uncharacterized protein n=1 Tax=Penicillium solitum TaxID=60172 RepID=A0A1V6RR01_9EURO|nr:uncharacterized protein PENSOL_c001G09559 [Penicillium solitum]OQE04096.1 hypothetical protein PENSOL_c001G09559 [Penicillium solitum]